MVWLLASPGEQRPGANRSIFSTAQLTLCVFEGSVFGICCGVACVPFCIVTMNVARTYFMDLACRPRRGGRPLWRGGDKYPLRPGLELLLSFSGDALACLTLM